MVTSDEKNSLLPLVIYFVPWCLSLEWRTEVLCPHVKFTSPSELAQDVARPPGVCQTALPWPKSKISLCQNFLGSKFPRVKIFSCQVYFHQNWLRMSLCVCQTVLPWQKSNIFVAFNIVTSPRRWPALHVPQVDKDLEKEKHLFCLCMRSMCTYDS